MEGFLVTMDIEKAFDTLDHKFLISVLKKFGFGQNFISWIEIKSVIKLESLFNKVTDLKPCSFIKQRL